MSQDDIKKKKQDFLILKKQGLKEISTVNVRAHLPKCMSPCVNRIIIGL